MRRVRLPSLGGVRRVLACNCFVRDTPQRFEEASGSLKDCRSSGAGDALKPMPTAESRRMLSETTLSRQPENPQGAVFERQGATRFWSGLTACGRPAFAC